MANLGSQGTALIDLLLQKLQSFDPNLDLSEGSSAYNEIVRPMQDALGVDPFDSPVEDFLRDRLRQEYPSIPAGKHDTITDLVLRPNELLMEPMKREIQTVRIGQSVRNSASMRDEDADSLAANWFTARREGGRSSTIVRVFFATAAFVSVSSTVTFTSGSGLNFFPTTPQFVPLDVVLLQKIGTEFYVDVPVLAEEPGDQYNIAAGGITRVTGLPGASRVTNINAASGGSARETGPQLLSRTQRSLTERSMVTRRGNAARLFGDFRNIRNLEVVGMGDPEMDRDVISGGGNGRVRSSGISFIVGQFLLYFSTYEDAGIRGTDKVSVGDEIRLNFWKFLYDVQPEGANRTYTIDEILFDTTESVANLPPILLIRINGSPFAPTALSASFPGVLPSVFSIITTKGVIEIADIPGGITNPDTTRGTVVVNENEIHIGGHYDVWIRPSSDIETVAESMNTYSSESFMEGTNVVTSGQFSPYRNMIHRQYKVNLTGVSGTFSIFDILSAGGTSVVAGISEVGTDYLILKDLPGAGFSVGDVLSGSSSGAGATVASVESFDWAEAGVHRGMLLALPQGNDTGSYRILDVDGIFLYIDTDLTVSEPGINFRVLRDIQVDIFDPKKVLVPFAEGAADNLRTAIGSTLVRTDVDLTTFGVVEGDTLEILEGDDSGLFTIESFDETLGGKGPVLSSQMSGTNSGLDFRVFRASTGAQRPMVRVLPGGVSLLDSAGRNTGSVVPYALPVDGRALNGFRGADTRARGRNGFILKDPGGTWAPTSDVIGDPNDFEDVVTCFSDECLPCEDGFIAVVSLQDDGEVYLDSGMPSAAQDFSTALRDWLLDVVDTLGIGPDVEEFINGFHPFRFGAPPGTVVVQFEVCIPREIFDGCSNVFVAFEEFDFEATLAQASDFGDALSLYNNGLLSGEAPALEGAAVGDSLTLLSGPNKGSYHIRRTFDYKLGNAAAVTGPDLSKFYRVTVAVIDGEFQNPPIGGLSEFFTSGGIPTFSLPAPPPFPGASTDLAGNPQSPWDWLELFFTWLFQWMVAIGFDLPDNITLDAGATLSTLWTMLFTEYEVGTSTCKGETRCYFIEPTSFTANGARPCEFYTWATPSKTGVSLTGEPFTLPLADLTGVEASMFVRGPAGGSLLASVLSAAAGTASTIEALAIELQSVLDPGALKVVFSGPATQTGALTVTSVEEGSDVSISIIATDLGDAFRAMGFRDGAGNRWPEIDNGGATPSYFAEHLSVGGSHGFHIKVYDAVAATLVDEDVTLTPGTDLTHLEIATDMATAILTALVADGLGSPSATVTFTEVLGQYVYTITIGGSLAVEFEVIDSHAGTSMASELFDGAIGVTGALLVQGLQPPGFFLHQLDAAVEDAAGTYPVTTTFSYEEAVSFDSAIDAASGDFAPLAAALNAFEDTYADSVERRVWWWGDGSNIQLRAVPGGTNACLTATISGTILDDMGFVDALTEGTEPASNTSDEGTTTSGTAVEDQFVPPPPTIFSVVLGSEELVFIASGDEEPLQVFPGQTEDGRVPVTELPRDIAVERSYSGALSALVKFTDESFEAPLLSGIETGGDVLWLHEQRNLLEFTTASPDQDSMNDRVVAVTTSPGSSVLRLLRQDTEIFDFLTPASGLDDDVVELGDLIFLEEGDAAAGYRVTGRSELSLTVDRPIEDGTATILRYGNDGVIAADTKIIESDTATFSDDDIGKYITFWAANRAGFDGSYRITAVSSLGGGTTNATVDTPDDFPHPEDFLHWAVVEAPAETPPTSKVGGRTELVGLRPIRIYRGVPTKLRVADVGTELSRTASYVNAVLDGNPYPRSGAKQPYQFVRPGVQRCASTEMSDNLEEGLYYCDIVTKSLGSDTLHNIERETKMEPVFGSYHSDGYRLEVEDTRLVYSSREQANIVFSTSFLPVGYQDQPVNLVPLEDRTVSVGYEYAPLVDQLQRFATSEADRVLCANPLVRHFLPSYVYLTMSYVGGGSPSAIAAEVIESIQLLEPTAWLDLSKVEKILHKNSVTQYDHPSHLIVVTHDLDRRLVGSRSDSRIGEEDVEFNGTNRTSFFIPGPDRSTEDVEADIPDGERIRMIKKAAPVTLR